MAGFGLYATGEGNAKPQKVVVGGGTPDATVVNTTQQGGTTTTPTATTVTPTGVADVSGGNGQGGTATTGVKGTTATTPTTTTTPGTTTTTPSGNAAGSAWGARLMKMQLTDDPTLEGNMAQRHATGAVDYTKDKPKGLDSINIKPAEVRLPYQQETPRGVRLPYQQYSDRIGSPLYDSGEGSYARWKQFLSPEPSSSPSPSSETFDDYFDRNFKPKKTTEELEKEREKKDRFEALTRGLKSLANLFTTSIGGVSTYDEAKDKAQYEAAEDAKMKRARQDWDDYYNKQSMLSNMEYRRSMAQKWQNELANKQADRDFEKWKFESKMKFDSDKEEERVKEWNREFEQAAQKLTLEGNKAKIDKWYKGELIKIKKDENANNKKLIKARISMLDRTAAKIGAKVTKHTDITLNGGGTPTAYDTTYEYDLDD